MADPLQVTIDLATPSDAARLGQLMQLYMHDMSEIFPVEVGDDGCFEYPQLSSYWTDAARFPFLIRVERRLAGFALVTRGSPASDDPFVFDLAEFFVVRRARGAGVGRRAAFALWDRMPGRWVVRVAEANRTACAFWPRVVAEYAGGSESRWTRPGSVSPVQVFGFASRGSA